MGCINIHDKVHKVHGCMSKPNLCLAILCCMICVIYSSRSYPTALDMVASGKVNVKPLITHTYKLEESLQAFERARTGADGAIKVMIRCGGQEE